MTHRPTLTATACGIAAAALLLTACGGGSDDDASKIQSSPTTSAPPVTTTPATTPPPTQDANAPVFDFPKDVTVEIKLPTTGDKVKDTILRDHAYAIQAIQLAYVKQNPELPVFLKYTTGIGQLSWAKDITVYRDRQLTYTGHMHYYDFKVTQSAAGTAGVSYCEDQSEVFDKSTKTGKVYRNTPNADAFVGWSDLVKKDGHGIWRVANSISKAGVAQCER